MSSIPKIIAHRGASGITPENTLDSIYAGISSGADIIEVDLQLTADNKLVLFHDWTVERILPNQGKKSISDYNSNKLTQLDVGTWFHPDYNYCRIPLLEDILSKHIEINKRKQIDFIFEIKSKSPEKLITQFLNLLDDYKYKSNTGYISVRDENAFNLIQEQASSKFLTGLMQKKRTPKELLSALFENKINLTQIRPKNWSNDDWNKLIDSGIKFTIFYGDTPKDYEYFLSKNPYGILTNFPARLKSYYYLNNLL